MGRAIAIFLIVAAVGIGVLVVLQRQGLMSIPVLAVGVGRQPEEPAFEAIDLSRGSIASTVSATGNIEPEAEVSLSFDSTGKVTQVLVTEGQAVRQGQLLAQLDVEAFQLARDEALVGQKIAQAKLNKLVVKADEGDLALARARINVSQAAIAAAEANLNARRAEYQDLTAGLSAADREELEAAVSQAEAAESQAEAAVNEARSNLEKTRDTYRVEEEDIERDEAKLAQADYAAKAARYAVEAARARLNSALDPPTQAELASAQHLIAQGEETLRQAYAALIENQNSLRDLEEGPDVEDVDIARSELDQARISYEKAQLNIENAQLLAPRDGVVSTANVRVGELFSGTTPAIVLSDLESYHMKVQVDEIDVRQVQTGQEVRLVLDALPDADIAGRVTSISPTANEVGSTITYEVEIVPEPTEAPLRAGMSATAIITTARVDNVLLIPNRYVQFDRDKNKYYVQKVVNGAPVLAEINIGLRNERESQILAGLSDGDQIALLAVDRQQQLASAIFGGG